MSSWRDLPSAQLTALYGLIRGAVEQRVTTAELWSSIRSSDLTATFQQVNTLRSYAASARNARIALAAEPAANAVTSKMISVAPWARDAQSRSLAPAYQLNIPYQYTAANGEVVQDWINKTVQALPATVGDVAALADSIVNESNTPPPDATVSGDIEIMAV